MQALLERLLASVGSGKGTKRPNEARDVEDISRDWPRTLPDLMFPIAALREDYSITTMLPDYADDDSIPLGREMQLYSAWCTQPVDLTRSVEYSAPVQAITLAGARDIIHGAMGFMFNVGGLRGYAR